jgi:6-phosphofructokinase 1
MDKKKNIAVVQTGGCSAVINSSLAGIVKAAQENHLSILGLENGFEGLLMRRTVDLNLLDDENLGRLRKTPGMFLGSSRMVLTEKNFHDIPLCLKNLGVDVLLMIGGNGTMYAAEQIRQSARGQSIPLVVIGVPKTVDNDIIGVDYAPGYASAARYIAQAVLDIGVDLESMKTFEQVRIIEVMGRSVGWLTAAAGLARHGEGTAPHLIYLPETDFDESEFLIDVKKVYQQYGFVVAVVGEGIHDKDKIPVGNNPFAELKRGSKVFGGASAYLAALVGEKLKVRARSQDLTMAQRCFIPMRSAVDEREAHRTGRAAVTALLKGNDGVMVLCRHDEQGYQTIPLSKVGGLEKSVPEIFYDKKKKQVTKQFIEWLMPVIEPWQYEYLSLQNLKDKIAEYSNVENLN